MASKYTAEAINGLSDAEKLRFALAYLHHNEPKNVDWAAAAAHSGSKSKESFKVMFNLTLRKLEKASNTTSADSEVASPAAKSNKRKKVDAEAEDDEMPTPKKRGRKKAAPKDLTPKEETEIDDAVKDAIKSEPEESFFGSLATDY
ncbi:hypothetical protein UCDDS831_g02611 [Diplodia seriata]|uniref:Uncharacterized protein n=1 Tax=Diplodia seriata TaxID=420778 RepID=A0A0G2GLB7_9PEZI|nr:hypothetical protein UCDDS831_g02611 [Diplodia seriata]